MSKKTKKIVILTEVELRKTISRLTCEIIEKVKKLDNLLLIGIPTRGIALTEVLEKELFFRTGLRVRKGTIDPTFYRDDQNRVGTRLIQAADIPTPIEKQEILLIDDVIFENGLPKLSEIQSEEEIIKWDKKPLKIILKNKSNIG